MLPAARARPGQRTVAAHLATAEVADRGLRGTERRPRPEVRRDPVLLTDHAQDVLAGSVAASAGDRVRP
jgi:hypothetical protein